MRLIDADALIADMDKAQKCDFISAYNRADIGIMVALQPTVYPVEHGYWKKINVCREFYQCSVCCNCERLERKYCPNCGAKMDADRPPKGKWRLLNGKWTCSECGNKTDWPLKICNVCASEMEIEL